MTTQNKYHLDQSKLQVTIVPEINEKFLLENSRCVSLMVDIFCFLLGSAANFHLELAINNLVSKMNSLSS